MKSLTLKIAILISLLSFRSLYAQVSPSSTLSLKLSPLSLINLYDGPCYKLGAEWNFYKAFSISSEYGRYIKVNNKYFGKDNIKGFIWKNELRYYLGGFEADNYLSVEHYYKNQDFGYWAMIKQDTSEVLRNYNISKKTNCFNLKFGQVYSYERFLVEWFAGLGFLFSKAKDDLTYQEKHNVLDGEGYGGISGTITRDTSGDVMLSITLGVRIGFILK